MSTTNGIDSADRQATVDATGPIVAALRSRGFRFQTLCPGS